MPERSEFILVMWLIALNVGVCGLGYLSMKMFSLIRDFMMDVDARLKKLESEPEGPKSSIDEAVSESCWKEEP
jgi:hypothetical protein